MPVSRIFVPIDSTEYIAIKVIGTEGGVTKDLSSTPVEIGIRSVNTTGLISFHTAEWEVVGGVFYARILIGPLSTLPLAVGTYDMWVRIFAEPQRLFRKSPTLLEIRPAESV